MAQNAPVPAWLMTSGTITKTEDAGVTADKGHGYAAQHAKIAQHFVAHRYWQWLDAGPGGDNLAGRQGHAMTRKLIGQPGDRDARTTQHARANPNAGGRAIHEGMGLMCRKVQSAPIKLCGGPQHKQMGAGIVGHQLRQPRMFKIIKAGIGKLDRRMQACHRAQHVFFRIGRGLRRQIASHLEAEFQLRHFHQIVAQRAGAAIGHHTFGQDAAGQRTISARFPGRKFAGSALSRVWFSQLR